MSTAPMPELGKQMETSRLAYRIWEAEGKPDGRDLEHWLKAEAELAARKAAPRKSTARPSRKQASTRQPGTS